jgi:hypothetical protein
MTESSWLGTGFRMRIFIAVISVPHYGPGDDSAFNINEYQEYLLGGGGGKRGWCIGLTTFPPSCADRKTW